MCPNICLCFFNLLSEIEKVCVCVCVWMCKNIKGDSMGRVTQLEFKKKGAKSTV